MKEESPFTPGSPVPVELFVGREEQIKEIFRYLNQTEKGRLENIFLSGERGIGKSSLGKFVREWAEEKKNFLTVHVFLGGVTTLEELVRKIFEGILKETKKENWFDKISGLFGKYIKDVGLFGVSVGFNPPRDRLKEIVNNFPEALHNIIVKINTEKNGILIVLDDINGISKESDFANWYKSFADTIATHYDKFPVLLMPVGLPEIRDQLGDFQPSLLRIFRVIEIKKLSEEEVEGFFKKSFDKVNLRVDPQALKNMVRASSGLPILMHEIGDAVFWINEDNVIDSNDTLFGILTATDNIGKKYIDPKVYRAIKSPRYISILRKLSKIEFGYMFKRKEIMPYLNEKEKKAFDNLLKKLRETGIIILDGERGRGAYKFTNFLYYMYMLLESFTYQQKKKKINLR